MQTVLTVKLKVGRKNEELRGLRYANFSGTGGGKAGAGISQMLGLSSGTRLYRQDLVAKSQAFSTFGKNGSKSLSWRNEFPGKIQFILAELCWVKYK